MSGADRGGFEWKQIAEVLHLSEVSARRTFSEEIQRLLAEAVDRQPRAIVHRQESDSIGAKLDKGIRGSRQTR
jgi:hypothetical protein